MLEQTHSDLAVLQVKNERLVQQVLGMIFQNDS